MDAVIDFWKHNGEKFKWGGNVGIRKIRKQNADEIIEALKPDLNAVSNNELAGDECLCLFNFIYIFWVMGNLPKFRPIYVRWDSPQLPLVLFLECSKKKIKIKNMGNFTCLWAWFNDAWVSQLSFSKFFTRTPINCLIAIPNEGSRQSKRESLRKFGLVVNKFSKNSLPFCSWTLSVESFS